MQTYQYRVFRNGALLTSSTGIVLLLGSACLGKQAAFLLLNDNMGPVADQFFKYWTYVGDGWIWVPLFFFFLVYHKKSLPLLISTIVLSTLIAQGVKNWIFPGEPRPTKAIADLSLIHTVPGVELHTVNSFPSGHTTTAFSIFLLVCLVIPQRSIVVISFVAALLVAYSRVYLAQHFPTDLGGGMLAAVLAVWASLQVEKRVVR